MANSEPCKEEYLKDGVMKKCMSMTHICVCGKCSLHCKCVPKT